MPTVLLVDSTRFYMWLLYLLITKHHLVRTQTEQIAGSRCDLHFQQWDNRQEGLWKPPHSLLPGVTL
jgi:hypothetical protein